MASLLLTHKSTPQQPPRTSHWTALALIPLLTVAVFGCQRAESKSLDPQAEADGVRLLNVSYDPTRELWRDLNKKFIADYQQRTGTTVKIEQSHAGSSSQARAVIDGLEADVVTLAMWADTNAVHRAGLIADGWEARFPNGSLPYSSTIVFVVRKGNPKKIQDWPDLIRDGVDVITPSAKTSGNGKLSFLAAWGSVTTRDGSQQDALDYVTKLYQHVSVLDSGARGSTTTFAQKKIGDVHLTWENEAYLEIEESKGDLEIVYPPVSIRAEPHVAVVDANVDRKGTRAVAEAYLNYLYTEEGQEAIARHHYRPYKIDVLHRHAGDFPTLDLFSIQSIAGSWAEAEKQFFAAGGVFDQIYHPAR